jgi:hypothetical protein
MAGTNFKPAVSGDSIQFSANWLNAVNNAAQARRKAPMSGGAPELDIHAAEGLIFIRNDSGADVPQFGILGIHNVLIDPATNLTAFKNDPALIGVVPTTADHKGKFVVCNGPLPKDTIGRAWLFGYFPVQINFASATDTFADVKDSDVTQLASSGSPAPLQILWSPGATGTQWALARLAGGGGGTISGGQYQYMLYQMVAQRQTGWGFAKGHPLI